MALKVTLMLLAAALTGQAQAQDAAEENGTRWQTPGPPAVKVEAESSHAPARVRIGLRLTPFTKVMTRNRKGKNETQTVPDQTLRHTLRARLDRVNHFFVGDYHVETKPLTWIKKSRRYKVRLNFFKRYGAFGQLEESLGHLELSGVLEEQTGNVYALFGASSIRIRDKFGTPVLDVVAGFRPGESKQQAMATPPRRLVPPKAAPTQASGAIIRGRF